ncbi:MAG: hypothetical protein KF752_13375 [Pirellulaceae bacterium]|nr:hypothetical protein [Pirellulaceae bacterium]
MNFSLTAAMSAGGLEFIILDTRPGRGEHCCESAVFFRWLPSPEGGEVLVVPNLTCADAFRRAADFIGTIGIIDSKLPDADPDWIDSLDKRFGLIMGSF